MRSPLIISEETVSRKSSGASCQTGDAIELAVLRYLARRDRTEAQVRAFLNRAGASVSRTQVLIKGFLQRGYLNDEAYALRWARDRLARRPMGHDRLEAELLAQGFDSATTARTLQRIYSERNERDLARSLLSLRSGSRRTEAARAGLLRRHGFREELIEELLGGSPSS